MSNRISAVVIVSERFDDIEPLMNSYRQGLDDSGREYQFVVVLDGRFPEVKETLERLRSDGAPLDIVQLSRSFGESEALNSAMELIEAETVLLLPSYAQVDASALGQVLDGLEDADVSLAVRAERSGSKWNRFQSGAFRRLLKWVSGFDYQDLGCGVRAYKKSVLDEVPIYGDLSRFLPLLAAREGFTVTEVAVPQDPADRARRVYGPGVYVRRLLDMLTVFFLVKFTKKPLRFFGLIGSTFAAVGGAVLAWLLVERIFFDMALGSRPALLLGALLFALGIQIIAVGLIGELIIFTHALNVREYSIDRVDTQAELTRQ